MYLSSVGAFGPKWDSNSCAFDSLYVCYFFYYKKFLQPNEKLKFKDTYQNILSDLDTNSLTADASSRFQNSIKNLGFQRSENNCADIIDLDLLLGKISDELNHFQFAYHCGECNSILTRSCPHCSNDIIGSRFSYFIGSKNESYESFSNLVLKSLSSSKSSVSCNKHIKAAVHIEFDKVPSILRIHFTSEEIQSSLYQPIETTFSVGGNLYELFACIYYNGSHFSSLMWDKSVCYGYDGLVESGAYQSCAFDDVPLIYNEMNLIYLIYRKTNLDHSPFMVTKLVKSSTESASNQIEDLTAQDEADQTDSCMKVCRACTIKNIKKRKIYDL